MELRYLILLVFAVAEAQNADMFDRLIAQSEKQFSMTEHGELPDGMQQQ